MPRLSRSDAEQVVQALRHVLSRTEPHPDHDDLVRIMKRLSARTAQPHRYRPVRAGGRGGAQREPRYDGPSSEPAGVAAGSHQDGILRGRTPALFAAIHDPAVELVIWERALAAGLGDWLDALPAGRLPDDRVLVREADLFPALTDVLDAAGTPACEMRGLFLQDVVALARLFSRTMGSDVVDIRLEAIRHDACWKFHRDCVAARLLTTYRGPGTEWVQPRDGAAALAGQKSYRGPIQRFPAHAVGLFKGNCAGPAAGIVHRSPPVAGTGTTRLLLCLNLPSAASAELWRPGQLGTPSFPACGLESKAPRPG